MTMPVGVDLGARAEHYQHAISDRYGFESMSVSIRCSLQEALYWLSNGLMMSVVVYGPDAQTVWEGYLETVTATIGQKRASLSVSGLANRCQVLYTDSGGVQLISTIYSLSESQARYGVKDRATTLQQSTLSAANYACQQMLASFAWPRSRETTDASTGALGEISLDLSFAGWYSTLAWPFLARNSQTVTDTGTQLSGYVLPTVAATNAFLSSDYTHIPTTGVTDSQYIAPQTYASKKIEALLGLGQSTNQQLAWGVYEDRVFHVASWAGATPSAITYTEDAGTGLIYDAYGNTIAPWDVRPNAMSQVTQLLDVGVPATAVDAAARKYVGRVTCSIQGESVGCTLEPSSVDSFDAFLATITPPAGW